MHVEIMLPAYPVSTAAAASTRLEVADWHNQVTSFLVLALEYFLLMTRVVFLLQTILNLRRKFKRSEFCMLKVIVNACLML